MRRAFCIFYQHVHWIITCYQFINLTRLHFLHNMGYYQLSVQTESSQFSFDLSLFPVIVNTLVLSSFIGSLLALTQAWISLTDKTTNKTIIIITPIKDQLRVYTKKIISILFYFHIAHNTPRLPPTPPPPPPKKEEKKSCISMVYNGYAIVFFWGGGESKRGVLGQCKNH